jgi:class 3 adenylate cyclase/tetratricopeptide (TPR) repeat protein
MAHSSTVTLLFTDLIRSTDKLRQAGDEFGQRLFQTHHKLMTDAVSAAGGKELQWLGDGVLAVFASASDAVRCAIAIQQTARRPIGGVQFEIRIGIHAGEVMQRDQGYFGMPLVVAKRLCDRATTGQILCSRLIAELLSARQTFSFRRLGALELKGIPQPLAVCEVVYKRNDPLARLNSTPFVGRDEPLKRLVDSLDAACNGRGSLTMVLGEAGIGKTRLLEEFTDSARERGAVIMRGACYDGAEWQRPYGPFAEAIERYAAQIDASILKEALGDGAWAVGRIAPSVRASAGETGETEALDKEEQRFRLLDAVSQFLIAISRRNPLVLILDDLHWADQGTAAMLRHVAHFVASGPIMLVGAYRDAEIGRRHPMASTLASLNRGTNFSRIEIGGLHSDDVAQLLEAVADHDPPAHLVNALSKDTEGNPFFLREVLLHLIKEGKVFDQQGDRAAHVETNQLSIPDSVREIINARLLKLSEPANRILSIGAAFNGAFSFEVVSAAAGFDEEAALDAIDEALNAQLLRPGTDSDHFEFVHALIRQTLYSDLSPPRRARMHRQIAEHMERLWGERAAEHAAEVAYHFWRGAAASGAERGADYAIAAANDAELAYVYDEAAAFIRIALELLPSADPRRPRLYARLASALNWTLNGDEAIKVAREAGTLILATEGEDAAADYYEQIARSMFLAGVMRGAWEFARDIRWASLTEIDVDRSDAEDPDRLGIPVDSPRRRELIEVIRSLPREQFKSRSIEPIYCSRREVLEDPQASPTALFMFAGEYRRSLPMWQQDAAENERRGALVEAMFSWASVSRCHNALGEFAEARAALDRAIALNARIPGLNFGVLNLTLATAELSSTTDTGWEETWARGMDNGVAVDAGVENNWASAFIDAYLAFALAKMNQPDLAIQKLARMPKVLEHGTPISVAYAPVACMSASTLWELNRADHTPTVERAIREKVLVTDFRYTMCNARLSLARLCALQGKHDEALKWLDQARDVLDEQGARPLRAISDYDHALMFLRRGAPGDTERAKPYLELAVRQFRDLGMTGWTSKPRTLLAGGPPRPKVRRCRPAEEPGQCAARTSSHYA